LKFCSFVLFVSLSLAVVAQSPSPAKTIGIPEPARTQLELAQTKLQNTQLKANQLQLQQEKALAQLNAEFFQEKSDFETLLNSTKSTLKVPDNGVYDGKTFSFNIPAEKTSPTKLAEPAHLPKPDIKK
jgi:hypothetical protein